MSTRTSYAKIRVDEQHGGTYMVSACNGRQSAFSALELIEIAAFVLTHEQQLDEQAIAELLPESDCSTGQEEYYAVPTLSLAVLGVVE